MTQEYDWLKDQSRMDEVVQWLGGRWDIDQLRAWAHARFSLDELKTWIEGKYALDDVVTWKYHESDPTADLVKVVIESYRPGIEEHRGSLAFLGIDTQGTAHIAFDGACGSCTIRETATMDNLKEDLTSLVPGIIDVVNDGPIRQATGNFSIDEFRGDSPVQIRTLGRTGE